MLLERKQTKVSLYRLEWPSSTWYGRGKANIFENFFLISHQLTFFSELWLNCSVLGRGC